MNTYLNTSIFKTIKDMMDNFNEFFQKAKNVTKLSTKIKVLLMIIITYKR